MEDNQPKQPLFALAVLPVLLLVVFAWLDRPAPLLRLVFLNTPGDALLVIAPDGAATLIDGGRDPAMLALLLGQELPFYQRELHAVLLTSPANSRVPGQIAALARYRPAMVLAPPAMRNTGNNGEWLRLLAEQQIVTRVATAGDQLPLGSGAILQVLAVAEGENGGMLLRIAYGATSALLHMGGPDLDAQALKYAQRPVALLAYPWQREPDEGLLQRLRPQIIVFSDGYTVDEPALLSYTDRAYGGAQIYHEKNEGSVTLLSDGEQAWVETKP